MNINLKSIVAPILILLFLMPPTLVSFIPLAIRSEYYYLVIFIGWITSFLFFFKSVFLNTDKSSASLFTIILLSSGIVTFVVKGEISLFSLLFPLLSLMGYKICVNHKINPKHWMNAYFVFLYILFYIFYFSIIPDYFYRPDFNEDFLSGSSSNTIPLALNTTLYAYMILNFLYKSNAERSILIISIINLLLNIIQQGRGGIIIGLILVFMALYEYAPRFIYQIRYFGFIVLLFVLYTATEAIINSPILNSGFYNNQTELLEYSFLTEKRIMAQLSFFNQLSVNNFFFGFPANTYFSDDVYQLNYTYNMFLDFWNKYNLLTLFILISIIINRIVNRNDFLFPAYYLIPFLIYAMIEYVYLTNFKDLFIYLVLFVKRDSTIPS